MNKIILIFSLLIVCIGLFAGQIDGTVTYSDTGEPAVDIPVSLFSGNDPAEPEFTLNTDETGYYIFPELGNGFHLLFTADEDYNFFMERIIINGSQPEVTLNIELLPFSPPDLIGSVSGTILNEAYETVEGALVEIIGVGYPVNPFIMEYITGPEGTYNFIDIPAGYYYVQAQAEGYEPSDPEMIMISLEESDLTEIDLMLEEFELPDPPGSVAGTVVDEESNPIEGALVHLFTGQGFPGDPLSFDMLTGSDGAFLFEDLPLEEYDLNASAEGYLPFEPIEVEITSDNPDTSGIILVLIEFQIPDPIGSISGVVIDQDSVAVQGAEVVLVLDEDEYGIPYIFEQLTDSLGTFLFEELPAGEYELTVFAEGFEPNESLELYISPETPDITDLIIILEPWGGHEDNGEIHGYVIDHLGLGVGNATVSITNSQNSFDQEILTNEEGGFDFLELPMGNYWLEVFAEGYLQGWFSNPGGQSVPIHINEDNYIVQDIYITLLPENGVYEGNCELTMIIQGDENPSEVNHVFLFNTNNGLMYRRLMFGSEFTIGELPEGMYIIGVHTPGYMMYFYEGADIPEDADLVELLEDNPVTIIVDLTGFEPESYMISGTITNDLGEPMEGAIVTAIPVNAGGGEGLNQYMTETDNNGYYDLEVSEGEYLISAAATDYSVSYWPGTLDFESAESIEVESEITGIDLILYPLDFNGFSIAGSVTIEGDLPEVSVMVIAVSFNEDGEEPFTRSVMAGSDGSYEIPLDMAGEYFLLAITSGAFPIFHSDAYDWEEAELVTVNSVVSDINLDLIYPFGQGLDNISGVITNEAGEPLTGVTVLMLDINRMPVAFGTTNSMGQYSISLLGNTEYTFLATKVYYESFMTIVNPADQDELNANLYPAQSTEVTSDLPVNTGLMTNYPNPFNPETRINFYISEGDQTELAIYNVKGQKVRTLINEKLAVGLHSVIWDGKNELGNTLTSGIYFYKLSSGEHNSVKKMILMK
ncbi:carboxypeptidase regulatory-like domain-containing protein [Candidatus Cloacimonadota bacterium]